VVGCVPQDFPAEVYRRPSGKIVTIMTQHPRSKAFFNIAYRYFLLTPSSVRVELTAPGGTTTLSLTTHEVETNQGGTRRRVVKGSGAADRHRVGDGHRRR
jgi:hypothetical protein